MTDTFRESPALAAVRFILEMIFWVSIYFAWGWVALALAVAALSIFSTPGDKHRVFIAVPGKLRLLLEVVVALAGIAAAYQVWAFPPAGALLLVTAVAFAASRKRIAWLWAHDARGGE